MVMWFGLIASFTCQRLSIIILCDLYMCMYVPANNKWTLIACARYQRMLIRELVRQDPGVDGPLSAVRD